MSTPLSPNQPSKRTLDFRQKYKTEVIGPLYRNVVIGTKTDSVPSSKA